MTGWFLPGPGTALRRVATPRLTMQFAEAGQGRPVVFLHGLGWDHSLWHPTLTRLAPRYHAIAGDTRGHGGSDAPDEPYDIAMFAQDWAALLDALGLREVCLVGLSQGGMVAQRLAAERPDLVAALVLVATACHTDPAGEAKMEARLQAMAEAGPEAAAVVAAESIFSPGWRQARPGELARFIAWRKAMPAGPIAAATRAAFGMDLRPMLPGIAVPVLVVSGDADRLTPLAAQAEIAALIPRAGHSIVAGAGHIIPVEQPDTFVALLDGFLAAAFPPAAPAGADTRETHSHG